MKNTNPYNPEIFYRVAHDITGQGLWYKSCGEFTGLIHDQLNFCTNKELQMPFDPEVAGYLSTTKTISELLLWFTVDDLERLEDFGFYITEYTATDYKEYKNHWLIKQGSSVVVKTIPVSEVTPPASPLEGRLIEQLTDEEKTFILSILGQEGNMQPRHVNQLLNEYLYKQSTLKGIEWLQVLTYLQSINVVIEVKPKY